MLNPNPTAKKRDVSHERAISSGSNASGSVASIHSPSFVFTEGHRGLGPSSPSSPKSPLAAKTGDSQRATDPTFTMAEIDPPHIVTHTIVEEPAPASPTTLGLHKTASEQMGVGKPKRDRPASSPESTKDSTKRANTAQ